MKREELIAYDKWLTRRKWGTGEIISPEKAADLYLAEHPLPPAEGAEQEKILTDFAEKMNTAMVNNDPEFEQIVNDHYFDLIEQPTAEGAGEILCERDDAEDFLQTKDIWNHPRISDRTDKESYEVADLMAEFAQKFATLHAQKIADKMVSERWINVKDGLPMKDGKSSIYCLVNSEYDGIVVRPYNEYHKCWDTEDADDYYCDAVGGKITHWMPLPNPPIK